MSFNGSGTFGLQFNWNQDKQANINITANRMQTEFDGLAAGLSNAICRDGQSTILADISWSNHRITGLADANASQDALNRQSGDARFLLRSTVSALSAAYTVVPTDQAKTFLATGTWTLALTAAATLGSKFSIKIKNAGSGVITVDPAGGELIDGVATLAIPPGASAEIACDGSAFYTTGFGQIGGISPLSGAYTVVAGDQSKTFVGTGSWTLSLAAAAALGPRFSVRVKNVGSGVITVDPNGAELIDGVAAVLIYPGGSADITCDGSAFWMTGFGPTGLLSAQGYARFGNGLILQWGSIGGGAGSADRTFPIAFPTAVVSVTATPIGNQPGATTGVISNLSNTGFTLFRRYNQDAISNDAAENFYYKAIGF